MKDNKLDFTTSNTGNHVVNSGKDGSDVKIPPPQVDEKRGFAKASPNVPKYSPKTVAKTDIEAEKIIEENVLDEDKKEEDKNEDSN